MGAVFLPVLFDERAKLRLSHKSLNLGVSFHTGGGYIISLPFVWLTSDNINAVLGNGLQKVSLEILCQCQECRKASIGP